MQTYHLPIMTETDNGDGTLRVYFSIDDKFKKVFMMREGLKRWSQKRFERVFVRALEEHMRGKTLAEMRSSMDDFAQNYAEGKE